MWSDRIEQKAEVLKGKPVIKDTRIAVDLILEKIGEGESITELLAAYPQISREDILACISYGASAVRNETLINVA